MNTRSPSSRIHLEEAKHFNIKNIYPPKSQVINHEQNNYLNSKLSPSKHWKTYLAPQLSQLKSRDYLKQTFQEQNLTSFNNYGPSNQKQNLFDRSRFTNPNQQYNNNDDYTRKKYELMNKIKILQEKKIPCEDQSSRKNDYEIQSDIQKRLTFLENRFEKMNKQIDLKIRKEITDMERRLKIQFFK